MTPRRRRGDPLTADQKQLIVLLADTDLNAHAIGRRLGITVNATRQRTSTLYAEFGVRSRDGLRRFLLECELAPVGGAS